MNQFKSCTSANQGLMLLELSLYLIIIGLTLVVGMEMYQFLQVQTYATQISGNILSAENNTNQYLTNNLLSYTSQLSGSNVVTANLTTLGAVNQVNNYYMGNTCLVMTLNSTQTAIVPILMSQVNGASLAGIAVNALGPSAALLILPTSSSSTTSVGNSSWSYTLNISTSTLKTSCGFTQNTLIAVNLGLSTYLNLQLNYLSRFVDNNTPPGDSANLNTMFTNLYIQGNNALLFESGSQATGLVLNYAQNALQVESGGFMTQWMQIESQTSVLASCTAAQYGVLYMESSSAQPFNGLLMCSYNPGVCSGSGYCFLPQQPQDIYESTVNLNTAGTISGGTVTAGVFTCTNGYIATLPNTYSYQAASGTTTCGGTTPVFSAAGGGNYTLSNCSSVLGLANICKAISLRSTWCICTNSGGSTDANCTNLPYATLNNFSCSTTHPLYFY